MLSLMANVIGRSSSDFVSDDTSLHMNKPIRIYNNKSYKKTNNKIEIYLLEIVVSEFIGWVRLISDGPHNNSWTILVSFH